jgi:GntR family transcriptional regulator
MTSNATDIHDRGSNMRIRLSRAEGAPPVYAQVASFLRQRIRNGELAAGAKLARELDLARQFGISRIPVRHALAILEREGLVRRLHGRGTFVADDIDLPEVLRLTGIVGWSAAVGTDHRLLSVADVTPHGEPARFFSLSQERRLTRFVRLRVRAGAAFNYIVNYVPVPLARRMRRENFRANTMVDMLRKRLKIRLGSIRQAIEATTADPTIARQLGVAVGAPVLYVETRIWRKSGAPLMFSQAYYRGDRSSYSIEVPGPARHE